MLYAWNIFKETSSTLHTFINFGSTDTAHVCVSAWHDNWENSVCIKLFIAYHAMKGQGRRHIDMLLVSLLLLLLLLLQLLYACLELSCKQIVYFLKFVILNGIGLVFNGSFYTNRQ